MPHCPPSGAPWDFFAASDDDICDVLGIGNIARCKEPNSASGLNFEEVASSTGENLKQT
jgi:hypothetical protein